MANPKINQSNWQYMITPREKFLCRDEKRVLAAKNAQQQLSFIKDEIAEACRSNRPYLLVCRDDNTRAWLDGRDVLFPNLRATLNGDRPLFADLRAFISLLIKLIVDCFKNNDNHEESIPEASLVLTI